MSNADYPTITLKQLRAELAGYGDDFEISFSGLDFYRVNEQGPGVSATRRWSA